jgi:hypothetical protein
MRRLSVCVLAPMMVLFFVALAYSDPIPHLINYQGMLTDDGGNPLNTPQNLTFRIYNVESGGASLWSETQNNVPVEEGLFSVILGSVDPIDLPFDEDYWLEIEVGLSDTLLPRVKLTSVGYAYRAQRADTSDYSFHAKEADTAFYAIEAVSAETDNDWTITGNDMYSGVSGNVGIGTTSPTAPLTIQPINGTDIEFAHGGFNADILASNQFNIGTSNPSFFSILTNNQFRLSVDGTGKVGIGTTTPSCPLEVTHSTWWDILKIGLGTTSDRLILSSGTQWASLSAGTTNANHIVIRHSSGNVGIGHTDPWKKLSVDGDIGVPYYGSYYLGIYEGLGWNNAIGSIRVGSDGPQCLQLHSGSATARMFIDTLGNVGIGTTTPDAVLDVYGTRSVGTSQDGIVNIGNTSDLHVTLDNNEIHARNGTNPSNLYINDFGGDVRIAKNGKVRIGGLGTPSERLHVDGKVYISAMDATHSGVNVKWYNNRLYRDASSEKYKEDIRPLEEDFHKILEAKPKSFIDKVSGERNIGFIAEEFDQLGLNHLVSYRDGEPDALKYELISLYLLEVVKDIKNENEELRKRIDALESRE